MPARCWGRRKRALGKLEKDKRRPHFQGQAEKKETEDQGGPEDGKKRRISQNSLHTTNEEKRIGRLKYVGSRG